MLRRLVSLPVVLGLALVAGAFACVRLILSRPDFTSAFGRRLGVALNPDIWWQIVAGEEILSTGAWPTVDTYSSTVAGNSWIAYQWLGGVLMALAARLGGLWGLLALLFLLSASLILLLYYYAYLRSRSWLAAFASCALVLPVIAVFLPLRPQLFGYVFLLITLICLERFRQGRTKSLWVLPPLFLLWVNVHGTFPFGFLVLGAYWVGGWVDFRSGILVAERWQPWQRRHLAVVLLLSVLAITATPYGTRLAAYPFELSFLQPLNVSMIGEWHPIPFDLWWGKLVLGLLGLFLVGQLLFPLTLRVENAGLLFVVVYSAFVHSRLALFLVLLLAPLLAEQLARGLSRLPSLSERPALNFVFWILLGGFVVGMVPSQQKLERVIAAQYPQGAVNYLRQNPIDGPIFNDIRWGGYLIWALGPEPKVFIDGRIDIYEYAGVFSDYQAIAHLDPQTVFLLRKYKVEACLLFHNAPLATLLRVLPEWEQVYADGLSVIYRLRTAAPDARK